LQVRIASALICSLMAVGASASAADAANTGGASVGSSAAPTTTAAPKTSLHLFPVTSRSSNVAYRGPVYVRTPTGEVVPYSPTTATSTTGTAASATGGIAPAASRSSAAVPSATIGSPGGPIERPELLVPGTTARYVNGLAAAPMSAPAAVQQVIWAGNELIGLPYVWAGGHASFTAHGYDCSGTVSFALHGAALLKTPEDSSELEAWGSHGIGRWVAVFSNPGHAYMTVAGLRLDTSAADDPSNQDGPRWRPLRRGNQGYTARHPLGL
jgi:cell wall-associated NlpC family hydrolase